MVFEKAFELVQLFGYTTYGDAEFNDGNTLPKHVAKKCAIVCVDEILNSYRKLLPSSRTYWEQVKQEIEKL